MSTGTDNGNIFSKSDSASMNLGKVPVSQGGMIPAAVGQQILTRLESIQQLMTESTLSQIQLKIYLYGGQLSTGFDFYPSIPEGEQGSAFVGTFGPLSNGTNMVSPYEGAEMCRLGTGLPSSGSLPTSAGNYITLQENTPNALLKDMYPGILNDIDFAFSTQTATGNQVIVGDGLAVDSQEGVYYTPSPAVGAQNTGAVDDFDSVPGYTPIMVKDEFGVDILPIEDLFFTGRGVRTQTAKGETVLSLASPLMTPNMSIAWDSRVAKVIRHPYKGRMRRLNTHSGLIDVTPNHSVIKSRPKEEVVDAKDIKVGDLLSMPSIVWASDGGRGQFFGDEELAWTYGFYLAEGCAGSYEGTMAKRGTGLNRETVIFSNQNRDYLERAQSTLESHFAGRSSHIRQSEGAMLLEMSNRFTYEHFRSLFYTVNGQKRVPRMILNAPEHIKRAFLAGYLEGDGTFYPKPWVWGYTTIYPSVAMGILHLMNSLEERSWTVHIRDDKWDAIYVRFNQKIGGERWTKGRVKKVKDFDYDGWVYDLVVPRDNTFMAGVGPIRVHNTFEFQYMHSYAAAYQNGGISQWDDFNKLYAVRVKWDIPWQRNIRCEIDNFMGNDTITVHEWDVNMVWQPNLKHITDMTKIYQGYPSSLPQSTLLPKARQ